VVARIINTARVHKAYAVSGGICLAAAAAVPGSVVNMLVAPEQSPFTLRIGHPSGVLALDTRWSSGRDGVLIEAAEIARDARIILRGTAYLPPTHTVAPLRATAASRLEPLAL
ncbi:MAG TPA: PrpF domain-containing protein, partial [Azonexus sp.]|nr:PrpF domain-containing protein [Azonexus sp.]